MGRVGLPVVSMRLACQLEWLLKKERKKKDKKKENSNNNNKNYYYYTVRCHNGSL